MVESLEVMIFESINIVPSKGGTAQTSMPRKKRHIRSTKQSLLVISFSAQFGFEYLYPCFPTRLQVFSFPLPLCWIVQAFSQGLLPQEIDSFLQFMPLLHIIDHPETTAKKQDIPTGIDPQTLYIPLRIAQKSKSEKG